MLLPDGDATYNANVLNQYRKLAALAPNLHVRLWDQFYKGNDADEVQADRWQNGTDTPFTTFHFNSDPELLLDLNQETSAEEGGTDYPYKE